MKLFTPNTAQAQAPCRHCGALDGFVAKLKAPHTGLYCKSCGGWLKWVKASEARQYDAAPAEPIPSHPWGPAPAKEIPPRFSPRQLAKPQDVDEKLAALEHDVHVIAQIVMGARHD